MRHQEYSVKATIDAVSTPYLVSHESDYFYSRTFSFLTIIFSFLAYENHPYCLDLDKSYFATPCSSRPSHQE